MSSSGHRSPRLGRLSRLLAAVWVLVLVPAGASDSALSADLVQRGRYLARAGNCISCHTTLDGIPYAGGVPFPTDFGVIHSTNITSDIETGIGSWTLEQFAAALRKGVRPDGTHLYPAFPYTAFTKLTDADVGALFAYFRTVPAARARPLANDMRFPFGSRGLLGVWKALFFEEGRFQNDSSQTEQWNRGAYLVEALGHCAACHSPRNLLGAERGAHAAFRGGKFYDEDEDGRVVERASVDLTRSRTGLGAWSERDIASYLKTGANSRTRVTGAMNAVILNSTRHLTDADIAAMAKYISSLSAPAAARPPKVDAGIMQQGALQYDIHCGTCHLPSGLGSADTAPPLVGSAIAQTANPASFIDFVLYGPRRPAEPPSDQWRSKSWREMPAFDQRLTDADAAALMTYVRNAWGNSAPAVTPDIIAAHR